VNAGLIQEITQLCLRTVGAVPAPEPQSPEPLSQNRAE
jgi:hypothetical protein